MSFMIAISRSTFINTDSDSFSRLMILMATFLPNTQWTPSFTRPANIRENKQLKQQEKWGSYKSNEKKSSFWGRNDYKWGKKDRVTAAGIILVNGTTSRGRERRIIRAITEKRDLAKLNCQAESQRLAELYTKALCHLVDVIRAQKILCAYIQIYKYS